MKIILDTHLLLWAGLDPRRLSNDAKRLIRGADDIFFSAASIWEISIKSSLGRADFDVDSAIFRRALRDNQYEELPVTGEHAAAVAKLPLLHRDPFDRLLVAQAFTEGLQLLTSDPRVAGYGGGIREV